MFFLFDPTIIILVLLFLLIGVFGVAVKGIETIAPIIVIVFLVMFFVAAAQNVSAVLGPVVAFVLFGVAVYFMFRYPIIILISVVALLLRAFSEDSFGLLSVLILVLLLCGVFYGSYILMFGG